MDEILDKIWAYIEIVLNQAVLFFDKLISPLEIFGAGFVIFLLAVLVVFLTRFISTRFVTQRYRKLKKEFEHWQLVRNEAMKHPDPQKGKALARNIDQAELNRAYYDYFFEGMLKNIVTNVLPILLTAAMITQIYTPENLMARFGDEWVFTINMGASQIQASSLFWYVISIVIGFVLYAVIKTLLKRRNIEPELAENNI